MYLKIFKDLSENKLVGFVELYFDASSTKETRFSESVAPGANLHFNIYNYQANKGERGRVTFASY